MSTAGLTSSPGSGRLTTRQHKADRRFAAGEPSRRSAV